MSWEKGSSLFYWRWSKPWVDYAKLGIPPKQIMPFPTIKRPARRPKADIFNQTLEKFIKFIDRGYFDFHPKQFTKSLIDYFCVPKGDDDVRVVFNGTSSGLNGSVWAPNFWLPTADSLLRITHFNSKYVDLDLGEMFLNFPLHPELQPYSGVDLSPFKAELKRRFPTLPIGPSRLIGTWNRTWMGFSPSPETSVRMYYVAEEFARGNRLTLDNPLRWDNVVLNLFGSKDYDPSLPNVYKWDDVRKQIAGDLKAYVDDLRVVGFSLDQAWAIARRVASYLQYLGIQDAPRKRRVDHGPWAGGLYSTTSESISKSVTQAKWDKGKRLVNDLIELIQDQIDKEVSYKLLEQVR